jgi:Cu+-exporting ATPase
MTRGAVLAKAASLERLSEHPVGRALVQAAQAEGLTLEPVEAFEAVPGLGIRG